MAYLFGLAVECGPSMQAAAAVVNHFRDQGVSLADGQLAALSSTVEERPGDGRSSYWALIVSQDFQTGAATEAIADSLSDLGRALQARLHGAPAFRFAVTGVEPMEAITFDDLVEALTDPSSLEAGYAGLVVSEELLPHGVDRGPFQPFGPGYLWIPYRGEHASGPS